MMITTTTTIPKEEGAASVQLGVHQEEEEEEYSSSSSSSSSIVHLVELVQHVQREGRAATPDEQDALARWMGWGPAAPAFERYTTKKHWAETGARLRMLLGPEGTDAAAAATPHSYFTDQYIARAIWEIAIQLGFAGGRVLEPGCGSGAVLAAAPSFLLPQIQMTGIEREPFSASVARLRFPEATIMTASLEKTAIVDDSFDLVVGNVPFASTHIYDREIDMKLSLHNYFVWRALRALRPGGLAILVTSHYTLDAKKDQQRTLLGSLARLLGVIRLPTGAHKAAGTEVVTDILVLQKRVPSLSLSSHQQKQQPGDWKGHDWMETSDTVVPGVSVNEYFAEHLNNILGTPTVGHGMHGENTLLVKMPSQELGRAIHETMTRIVMEAQQKGAFYRPPVDRTQIGETVLRFRQDGRKEGSYHLTSAGTLVQIIDGEEVTVPRIVPELTALVHLRNATTMLLERERDFEQTDEDLLPLRTELNKRYDAYIATYGPIHRAKVTIGEPDPETGEQTITRRRPAALYAFSKDPDYCIVLGLEDYDDTTKVARKAPIFAHRVHTKPVRRTHADSPGEALALCLDDCGYLDLTVIAQLIGGETQEEDVPTLLGDLIYEVPGNATRTPFLGWQPAAEYLSGNIRVKLEEARKAAEKEPDRYGRNVAALEKILPEDILPEEIKALLGATWVAPEDIEQFCQDTFGMRPTVSVEKLTSSWQVYPPSYVQYSAAATSEWGTSRMHAYRLVEVGLNKGVPVVYDTLADETKVKNIEETLAAQDKLRVIQARFGEWVWEERARATRLAAVYNRLFNSAVPRVYDGAHLNFPGMSAEWQQNLYPWQKDFIWRMISSPSALCAHPVGAGKTTIEIAGGMTLKRMGLVSKAAIVVPNHLLEQITAEAQRLYPGANILMVSRDDLARERRKLFAARIATGDYDLVVMTHSGLGAIGVHPDTEKAYIDKRIAIFREAVLQAEDEGNGKKYSVKKLEAAIEKLRQRQEELLDKPHDDGVTFEQLGISYLIVDEAHLYKNLGLPTNVQGLQVKAAKRAIDLEMKLRWLEEHNEGKPFASFFTATPISNSMVEAYVLAWYLNQKLLGEYNLYNVDAFASTFIEFQTRVEVSPNGASFRLHTRASRFVNVPEFLALFTRFADLRDPNILSGKRPQRREHTVTIEPSEEVQNYVNDLVARSEEIQQGKPRSMGGGRVDNMLWVTTSGRMAALDLSLVEQPQDHSPKLEAVADHMLEVYTRWQEEASYLEGEFKSLQIGFCDLGTPNEEEGDQVYGRLKRVLIMKGIPSHGIRYIHEAKTDAAKAVLFQQCRSGEVAILLGSTSMLGTGTNIQDRGAALHHIDAPWRPDEVEQREGRIQRPGNLYPEVEIFRYVQRRTFDAYSWQTLANKAVFFDQLRSGKIKGREVEELGDSALSYGQVKAAATGDPLVLEQADLSVTIAHMQRLKAAHIRARHRDAQEATYARQSAADAVKRADRLREIADQAKAATRGEFFTAHNVRLTDRSEIGDALADRVLIMLNRGGGQDFLGTYQGINVHLSVLKVGIFYAVTLILGEHRYGFNASNTVNLHVSQEWIAKGQHWRFASAIEQFIETAEETSVSEAREAELQLARANDFEIRAREPFVQEAEITRLLARKRLLDDYTKASASAAKGGADGQKQQEVAMLREQLLKDAPRDFSEVTVVLPTRIAPPIRRQQVAPVVVESTPPGGPVIKREEKEERKKSSDGSVHDEPVPPTTVVEARSFTIHKYSWEALRQQQEDNRRAKKSAAKKKEHVPEGESLWSFLPTDSTTTTETAEAEQVVAATLW